MRDPVRRNQGLLALGVAVAITALSGWGYGRFSNRWGPPAELVEVGAKLREIPTACGQWKFVSSQDLSEDVREMLESTAEVTRVYVDDQTGEYVSMILVVGPVGPLSIHNPQICFPAQNYRPVDARTPVKIRDAKGTENTLWAATFASKGLEPVKIRVYWGWSTGGPWSAPNDARFAFGGAPHLYKIQCSCLAPASEPSAGDPSRRFLKDFLAVASPILVGKNSP